jgi:hypothetical protein
MELLNQEEIEQGEIVPTPLPEPEAVKEPIPFNRRRFVVAWAITDTKETVIVYDKVHGKIVYKVTCKCRKKAYPYIEKYYEKGNCIFVGSQDLRKFEC